MPSREEIAGWLREAADLAYDYSPEGVRLWAKFDQRAAQVENMRCKTCKHRDIGWCAVQDRGIYNFDSNCFSHEPKETQK